MRKDIHNNKQKKVVINKNNTKVKDKKKKRINLKILDSSFTFGEPRIGK